MIKAHIDLTVDLIKHSIREYTKPAPSIYDETYDWIRNNAVWKEFNTDWAAKLTLVFSWMPKIVGRDCDFPICSEGESFEACMQRHCRTQVLNRGFHIDQDMRLVDPVDQASLASLATAYQFLLGVVKQVAASKILHFSFPALCLMWDNDQIKWLYQRKSRKVVSAQEYVDYHRWSQQALQSSRDRDLIVERYGHAFPRVFDKCVWICSRT